MGKNSIVYGLGITCRFGTDPRIFMLSANDDVHSYCNSGKSDSVLDNSPRNRRTQAVTRLAVSATHNAIKSARIREEEICSAGLILGMCHGRAEFVHRAWKQAKDLNFANYCDPISFVNSITSAVVGKVAIDLGIEGLTLAINTGELTGLDAIGLAHQLLQAGYNTLFLAGGADSAEAIALASDIDSIPENKKIKPESGAAVFVMGHDCEQQPSSFKYPVCLVHYATAALFESENVKSDLKKHIMHTLSAGGITEHELDLIVTCRTEDIVDSLLPQYCDSHNIALVNIESFVGCTAGGSGALAAAYAAVAIGQQTHACEGTSDTVRSALVIGVDKAGLCSCLLFRIQDASCDREVMKSR